MRRLLNCFIILLLISFIACTNKIENIKIPDTFNLNKSKNDTILNDSLLSIAKKDIKLNGNLIVYKDKEKIGIKVKLLIKKTNFNIKGIESADVKYIKAYVKGPDIIGPIFAKNSDIDGLINVSEGSVDIEFESIPYGKIRIITIEAYNGSKVSLNLSIKQAIKVEDKEIRTEISYRTSPVGNIIEKLIQDNQQTIAENVNLISLQNFIDEISCPTGSAPNYTYTKNHPRLIKWEVIENDLITVSGDVGLLDSNNPAYVKSFGKVTFTISGLISSDKVKVGVTDGASQSVTVGNGLNEINNVEEGNWLLVLTENNHINYSYNMSSNNIPVTIPIGGGVVDKGTITLTPPVPQLNWVIPPRGSSGKDIILRGTNFHPNIDGNIVDFGGVHGTIVSVTKGVEDEIKATIPPGVTNKVNLSVKVSSQTSNTKTFWGGLPGYIYGIAGIGIGNGNTGDKTIFKCPVGIASDSAGNIYIADRDNPQMRKWEKATGIVTKLFDLPYGALEVKDLYIDGSNNIYFTQYNRVCVYSPSGGTFYGIPVGAGGIGVVAGTGTSGYSGDGGPATSATLSAPIGITIDSNGNLIIADWNNNRVRAVCETDGTYYGVSMTANNIYTIVGTGSSSSTGDNGPGILASVDRPADVGIDSSGNLYITEFNGHRIRKLEPTGTIRLFKSGQTYATMIRIDADDNIFYTISEYHNIKMIPKNNGTYFGISMTANNVYTIGGGTYGYGKDGEVAYPGKMAYPWGIEGDSNEIIFCDKHSHRIRKISSSGIMTTIAGGWKGNEGDASQSGINGPGGVTLNDKGEIYISSLYDHEIRKVDTDGKITLIGGEGVHGYQGDGSNVLYTKFNGIFKINYMNNNFYIADTYNYRIRKISSNNIINTIAGNGTYGYSGDGGLGIIASLYTPYGVSVDSSGNVYIADYSNNRIRKVDTNGIITTFAGTGSTSPFNNDVPAGLANLYGPIDTSVNSLGLYICQHNVHRIRFIPFNSGTYYGQSMTAGNIYNIVGTGAGGYNGDNIPATSAYLWNPYGVEVDNEGNIYIADSSSHRIRFIPVNNVNWYGQSMTGGNIYTIAGTGAYGYNGDNQLGTSATLWLPRRVALDSVGNVYISDSYNDRVRVVYK